METVPKQYWFKRKRFGWGWTPTTWQGWMVIALFTIFVLFGVALVKNAQILTGILCWVTATVILTAGSLLRGPKPKWRWGWKPDDDPDKDF